MKLEEPLHFAATHAEAKLPWKPDRSSSDRCPARRKARSASSATDRSAPTAIAVVAGPAGPVAESELEAEPQGLTARDLDTYLGQLAGEDRGAAAAGNPARH